MDSQVDLESRTRLIVVIPECLSSNSDLARKISHMAANRHADVLYLTLLEDEDRYLTVSRSMATLKALTAGRGLVAQSKLVKSSLWLKSLSELYRPGDLVVCNREQTVSAGFLKAVPADEWICRQLGIPVQTVSGFYNPERTQVKYWLHALVTWLGFIAILGVFTLLEIKFGAAHYGAAGRAIFLLLIAVEYGAVWAWNRANS